MPRRPVHRLFAALLCLALVLPLPGCFGQFVLTKTLYGINAEVQEPYLRSAVAWAFLVPYAFTSVLDFTVFNVIEFWSGRNPMAVRTAALPGGGSASVTLLRDGDGATALLDRYEGGKLVETAAIRDDGRGTLRAVVCRDGRLMPERRATLLADGSVEVYEEGSLSSDLHPAAEVASVASRLGASR
jgi:hypothetical protein